MPTRCPHAIDKEDEQVSVLSDDQRQERIAAIERYIAEQEAAGRAWSGRSVYQALGGSHGFLTAYLQQRRATSPAAVVPAEAPEPRNAAGDVPVACAPPLAPLPAPPPDPVEEAEATLKMAALHLDDARQSLLEAKGVLLATLPLRVDGVLHGSLHPSDEIHQQALDDVTTAKRLYDEAWSQRESARQELQRLQRDHREGHQKAHVALNQPQLVQAVAHWQEQLRTATSDRMHAHAKKEYQSDMYQYNKAVAQAPYTPNGTTP